MKEETRAICGLLASDRADLQCAAALVLGELRTADPQVIRFLGETLQNGQNRNLKGYVLDALEKIRSRDALPFVLPLLENEGENELQEKAIRVMAGLGAGVGRDLGLRLRKAGATERRAILLVLARIRGAQATRILLESLQDERPGAVDDLVFAVRHELKRAPEKDRREFVEQVRRFLAERGRPVGAQAAALRVLGFVDEPSAWPILIRQVRPGCPAQLRAAALAALRTVPRPVRSAEAAVRPLLECLDDSDLAGIVRPALETLEPMTIPAKGLAELQRQADSRHVEVRRFALRKLGELGGRGAVDTLLRFVDEPEAAVREVAATALARLDGARDQVLARLLAETRCERAWVLARVLKERAGELTKVQVASLGERTVRHLDHENRLYEPLVFLLRHASEQETRAVMLRRALRKKRSRRFEDTAHTLRLLERHGVFDGEVRYELAIALLKQSPCDPAREARAEDPVLRLLTGLVSDEIPLFDRLRKETVLTPEELAYLGEHFIAQENAERALGAELLRLVMRKAPRSPTAKDARACLQRFGMP